MTTVNFDKKSTRMIAHRGLSGLETENTVAAFIAAANRSYTGIETDVYKTADGRFVVIHDGNTQRVGGVNCPVVQATYEEINRICLKDHDGVPRSHLRVPLLEDYLAVCRKYNKMAVVELKALWPKEDIGRVIELIREQEWLEQTVFIAFDWDNLVHVREFLPQQPVQFLTGKCDAQLVQRLIHHGFGLDAHQDAVTREWVEKLHAHGLEVNCWTVNEPADGARLAGYGVDYITTNILE